MFDRHVSRSPGWFSKVPRRRRRRVAPVLVATFLFGVFLIGGAVDNAAAQRVDRPNALEAEKAIQQLRSPYCPGFMLEVCTSSAAAALRDSIYDLAAEGATADELIEWMISRHGEEWRALPKRSGAGLWAWLIPPFAILIGATAVVGWLRANRSSESSTASAPAATPPVSQEERSRIAAALREWEASGEEEEL